MLCYIYSFTIAANKDSQWELSWLANFLVFLFNDVIAMPVVILFIKFILALLSPEIISSLDKEFLSAKKMSYLLNMLESDKMSQPSKKSTAKIHPHPGNKVNQDALKSTVTPIFSESDDANSKPLLPLGITLHDEVGHSEKNSNSSDNDTLLPLEINSHTSLLNHDNQKENTTQNPSMHTSSVNNLTIQNPTMQTSSIINPSRKDTDFEKIENELDFKIVLEEGDQLLGV